MHTREPPMKLSKIAGLVVALVSLIFASLPATADGARNYGGRYSASANAGPLSLVLIQQGDKVMGRLDGPNGQAMELAGSANANGLVGTANTGKGELYFAASFAANGALQVMFAQPDGRGGINEASARVVVFSPGNAPAQAAAPAMQPFAAPPPQPVAAGQPSVQQCKDAASACQNQCLRGKRELIYKCFDACSGPYKQCLGGRSSGSAASAGDTGIGNIQRDQFRMHLDKMDCMGDYRQC